MKRNKKTKFQNLKEKFRKGKISKKDYINQAMNTHSKLFEFFKNIQKTNIHKISISSEGVSFVVENEKIELFIPPDEKRVAPIEIINFDKYEHDVTFIMNFLSSGSKRIFDIGANIGIHSLRFAKRNPKSLIYAIEPMKISYSYLKKNILFNKLSSKVLPFNYVFSDKVGKVNFFIIPNNSDNSSLLNVSRNKNRLKTIAKSTTLDKFCSFEKVKPDLIKCDVEGSELFVFKGGYKTILANKPIIITELLRKWTKAFNYHPNDLINYLGAIGYVCFGIGKGKVRLIKKVDEKTIETNYCFLNTIKHHKLINKLKKLKW